MKNQLSKSIARIVEIEVEKKNAAYRKAWGAAATKLMISMGVIVLHDDFKFGPVRLQRFQERFEAQAECIHGEFCSLEEIQQLADELSKRAKVVDVGKEAD